MQRNRRIRAVVLPAVEFAAGLEQRAHVHALGDHSRGEVRGGVECVVAEGVAAHTEGARVDVKGLVAEAVSKWTLIVELQGAVVRETELRNAQLERSIRHRLQ